MPNQKVWLIGAGNIGFEYARILYHLGADFVIIGRSEVSAAALENKLSEQGLALTMPAVRGGLNAYLESKPDLPAKAIVALPIESLQPAAMKLLEYGVQDILLEKPGFGYPSELQPLVEQKQTLCTTDEKEYNVLLAFNRRFYSSTFAAEEIIREDGGVTSFHFEFTEWAHVIEATTHLKPVNLETLVVNNSAHVIDTAFFLGGEPEKITCFHTGGLSWHPASSIFAGAGVTQSGALFSYHANWEAPGRWAVEILTRKHRLYLKPMESLQIQEIGSVAVNPVEIDNQIDIKFKPGFYRQTKAFLEGDYKRFCTIEDQKRHLEQFYLPISGYGINQR